MGTGFKVDELEMLLAQDAGLVGAHSAVAAILVAAKEMARGW
jgi:hypothetical protein